MINLAVPKWAYAYGGPSCSGDIKTIPEDFFVEEILSFQPEGSGEHVFLFIEKIGENTEYIARLLARHAGVRQRDVSFAGLKDRHGRTRQWFSVWLPGKEDPDWLALETDRLKILQTIRHTRKLKRGVLKGNHFELMIRNWQGHRDSIEQQLIQIQQHGFPNYFGAQRFGHDGQNIGRALALFQGGKVNREQRSLYLSAARSFLFNLILAERVRQQNWHQALPGDVFKLDGSNSLFANPALDQSLLDRVERGDIHPTGALWGKGQTAISDTALALEQKIIESQPSLAEGLEKAGVEIDRRALRAIPNHLSWQFESGADLRLIFDLPAGSYATALLREIVRFDPR